MADYELSNYTCPDCGAAMQQDATDEWCTVCSFGRMRNMRPRLNQHTSKVAKQRFLEDWWIGKELPTKVYQLKWLEESGLIQKAKSLAAQEQTNG